MGYTITLSQTLTSTLSYFGFSINIVLSVHTTLHPTTWNSRWTPALTTNAIPSLTTTSSLAQLNTSLFFYSLGDCLCGLSPKDRVLGGKETRENQFPWMVGIYNKTRKRFFCGASLISNRWILSAAHCFPDGPGLKKKNFMDLFCHASMGSWAQIMEFG